MQPDRIFPNLGALPTRCLYLCLGSTTYHPKSSTARCRHIPLYGNFTCPIRLTAFVLISQHRSIFGYMISFPSHVPARFLFCIVSSPLTSTWTSPIIVTLPFSRIVLCASSCDNDHTLLERVNWGKMSAREASDGNAGCPFGRLLLDIQQYRSGWPHHQDVVVHAMTCPANI